MGNTCSNSQNIQQRQQNNVNDALVSLFLTWSRFHAFMHFIHFIHSGVFIVHFEQVNAVFVGHYFSVYFVHSEQVLHTGILLKKNQMIVFEYSSSFFQLRNQVT